VREPHRLGELDVAEPAGQQHQPATALHGGELLLVSGGQDLVPEERRGVLRVVDAKPGALQLSGADMDAGSLDVAAGSRQRPGTSRRSGTRSPQCRLALLSGRAAAVGDADASPHLWTMRGFSSPGRRDLEDRAIG